MEEMAKMLETKMLELLSTKPRYKDSIQSMTVAEHARLVMMIPPSKNMIAELHDKFEKEYATLSQR